MLYSKQQRAGFTVMEVLVVLAILSLAVTIFAVARPGPSYATEREALVTAVIADAARARANAMTSGAVISLPLHVELCLGSPEELIFFPSGTATPATFCLSFQDTQVWLQLDPLTGLLHRAEAP